MQLKKIEIEIYSELATKPVIEFVSEMKEI